MARRPRILFEGAIYHVTFRGNSQQEIFHDSRDRRRMIERLEECADIYQVRIYNYCLMPNHVHLLLETPLANLNRFMSGLLTGYTVYFNKKHSRSGHVLQGRYGAQLVSGDGYLLKLSRYIHLNPVKTDYWEGQSLESKREFLRQYAWSSYRSFIGAAGPLNCLHRLPILSLVPVSSADNPEESYSTYVEAGLAENEREFVQLMKKCPLAIGPDSFVQDIKLRYEAASDGRVKKEDIALRKILRQISPNEVMEAAGKLGGFNCELIHSSHHGFSERCLIALALQKYSGQTQREIAETLGVTTGAAVSALLRRCRGEANVINWMKELDELLKG